MLTAREHPTGGARQVAQPDDHHLMEAMVRVSEVGASNDSGGQDQGLLCPAATVTPITPRPGTR
jgi:hypothetical protein